MANLLKPQDGGAPGILENLGITTPNWLAYGAFPIIFCEALHLFPFAFLLFGNDIEVCRYTA